MGKWSQYRQKVGQLNEVLAEFTDREAELRAEVIHEKGPVRGRVSWYFKGGGEEDEQYYATNDKAQAVLDQMSPVGQRLAYAAPWLGTDPDESQ